MEETFWGAGHTLTEFYLGFIIWGRIPKWLKVMSFLGEGRGSGSIPLEFFLNEYVLRCNLVHFETQF